MPVARNARKIAILRTLYSLTNIPSAGMLNAIATITAMPTKNQCYFKKPLITSTPSSNVNIDKKQQALVSG